MRAIDVMTKDVVTATPEMTVQDVAKLMINHRISGIPIVEGDRQLVGIVTEGDLLRRSETGTERQHSRWSEWFSPNSRLAAKYIKSHARRLADIMTRDVVNVSELATLGEIADLMEAKADQARAGRTRRKTRRHRQPRQSPENLGQRRSQPAR